MIIHKDQAGYVKILLWVRGHLIVHLLNTLCIKFLLIIMNVFEKPRLGSAQVYSWKRKDILLQSLQAGSGIQTGSYSVGKERSGGSTEGKAARAWSPPLTQI
jgi:hypothetical protein